MPFCRSHLYLSVPDIGYPICLRIYDTVHVHTYGAPRGSFFTLYMSIIIHHLMCHYSQYTYSVTMGFLPTVSFSYDLVVHINTKRKINLEIKL